MGVSLEGRAKIRACYGTGQNGLLSFPTTSRQSRRVGFRGSRASWQPTAVLASIQDTRSALPSGSGQPRRRHPDRQLCAGRPPPNGSQAVFRPGPMRIGRGGSLGLPMLVPARQPRMVLGLAKEHPKRRKDRHLRWRCGSVQWWFIGRREQPLKRPSLRRSISSLRRQRSVLQRAGPVPAAVTKAAGATHSPVSLGRNPVPVRPTDPPLSCGCESAFSSSGAAYWTDRPLE